MNIRYIFVLDCSVKAPKLKGRPRKKRKKLSISVDESESESESSSQSTVSSSNKVGSLDKIMYVKPSFGFVTFSYILRIIDNRHRI